jgi:hypothetical protein
MKKRATARMMLALALAIPLAGCTSGTAEVSAKDACLAHGGSWDPATQACAVGRQ